jgi:enamine deaminase RidA (YjgF/YER057c/UK114 family)
MRQPPSPAQIHRYAHLRNYCRKPRLRALALLYISGDVGVRPDGTVLETIEAQAEACWRNITAILADAGMGVRDLVEITTYLVRPEDVAAAGAARAKRPGSATHVPDRQRLSSKRWSIRHG